MSEILTIPLPIGYGDKERAIRTVRRVKHQPQTVITLPKVSHIAVASALGGVPQPPVSITETHRDKTIKTELETLRWWKPGPDGSLVRMG